VKMGPWTFGRGEHSGGSGTPIKVNGEIARKGLGVHPPDNGATRVAYALGGKAVTLAGAAALNDYAAEALSPVVFTIVGDGRELWRSGAVNRATGPARFRVDVTGVKVLELRALQAGSHLHAHAVWIDPVIEK
jgi:endo-alpha-N-acetylgalactosaminidase